MMDFLSSFAGVSSFLGIIGLIIYAFIHISSTLSFRKTIDPETIVALKKHNLDINQLKNMPENTAQELIKSHSDISDKIIGLLGNDSTKRNKVILITSIALFVFGLSGFSAKIWTDVNSKKENQKQSNEIDCPKELNDKSPVECLFKE
ncbi:hypothetical protein SAMN05660964_03807 [Thiothrix caldifontis]|uniref:Uncharacterized protein n=1 Tax=Thiothrix caldifontis TaxID=525918 RepID=A0A1H4GZI3_9GAMM|nr:hypothetical protein [Thiothrix caldifontis]SEB14510.1 hypothetical protein SAMN05660964_03807 [Thiothrix caldifontis]